MLKKWDDLPDFMRIPEVRPYWEALNRKRAQLYIKRLFDFIFAALLLVFLAFPMIIIAILIKIDSPGPILYRQERITAYGKKFKIHKFRTMIKDADKIGSTVTVNDDQRITKIGLKIRRLRLDELPQLFDVLDGSMSFVGTRPEAIKYVMKYKPEYFATLLLPAGITSETSIRFKNEDKMLSNVEDVDQEYLEKVLPLKMKLNLESVKHYSLFNEMATIFKTFSVVVGKTS